eukprot:TRINITY_DN24710_c0_g1_i1.p1 TRINITY_DN24710_c0_g1~~TRINITY_DN24710_c0_g1_i1.p1  ORF type:complete len:1240 (-),score=293.66 TRINITY_DN24710_c0_g1_i1:81-3800(-)
MDNKCRWAVWGHADSQRQAFLEVFTGRSESSSSAVLRKRVDIDKEESVLLELWNLPSEADGFEAFMSDIQAVLLFPSANDDSTFQLFQEVVEKFHGMRDVQLFTVLISSCPNVEMFRKFSVSVCKRTFMLSLPINAKMVDEVVVDTMKEVLNFRPRVSISEIPPKMIEAPRGAMIDESIRSDGKASIKLRHVSAILVHSDSPLTMFGPAQISFQRNEPKSKNPFIIRVAWTTPKEGMPKRVILESASSIFLQEFYIDRNFGVVLLIVQGPSFLLFQVNEFNFDEIIEELVELLNFDATSQIPMLSRTGMMCVFWDMWAEKYPALSEQIAKQKEEYSLTRLIVSTTDPAALSGADAMCAEAATFGHFLLDNNVFFPLATSMFVQWRIRELRIKSIELSQKEWTVLSDFLSDCFFLKAIELSECNMRSNNVSWIFVLLSKRNSLWSLDLHGNELGNKCLGNLFERFQQSDGGNRLLKLDLSFTGFNDKIVPSVVSFLTHNQSITDFYLKADPKSEQWRIKEPQSMESICRAMGLNIFLERIRFAGNAMFEGADDFLTMICQRNIKGFGEHDNVVVDDGDKFISVLPALWLRMGTVQQILETRQRLVENNVIFRVSILDDKGKPTPCHLRCLHPYHTLDLKEKNVVMHDRKLWWTPIQDDVNIFMVPKWPLVLVIRNDTSSSIISLTFDNVDECTQFLMAFAMITRRSFETSLIAPPLFETSALRDIRRLAAESYPFLSDITTESSFEDIILKSLVIHMKTFWATVDEVMKITTSALFYPRVTIEDASVHSSVVDFGTKLFQSLPPDVHPFLTPTMKLLVVEMYRALNSVKRIFDNINSVHFATLLSSSEVRELAQHLTIIGRSLDRQIDGSFTYFYTGVMIWWVKLCMGVSSIVIGLDMTKESVLHNLSPGERKNELMKYAPYVMILAKYTRMVVAVLCSYAPTQYLKGMEGKEKEILELQPKDAPEAGEELNERLLSLRNVVEEEHLALQSLFRSRGASLFKTSTQEEYPKSVKYSTKRIATSSISDSLGTLFEHRCLARPFEYLANEALLPSSLLDRMRHRTIPWPTTSETSPFIDASFMVNVYKKEISVLKRISRVLIARVGDHGLVFTNLLDELDRLEADGKSWMQYLGHALRSITRQFIEVDDLGTSSTSTEELLVFVHRGMMHVVALSRGLLNTLPEFPIDAKTLNRFLDKFCHQLILLAFAMSRVSVEKVCELTDGILNIIIRAIGCVCLLVPF